VIASFATLATVMAEPRDARMLVVVGSTVVARQPDGTRTPLLGDDAQDAAYSPDGTLVAFSRGGDIWLANADGSGQRRLAATPKVEEWSPSWLPDGSAIVYTARVDGRRQIRVMRLPTGYSTRLDGSNGEEYSATVSRQGRLAFVSTRSGTPAVYVAKLDGSGVAPFDTTAPATPYLDEHDLAWSPDGTTLAYRATTTPDTPDTIVVDDGTTQTALVSGFDPVWSPTGTRLGFDDATHTLTTVAPDGTDLRTLGPGKPLDWRVVPIGKPVFPNLVQRPPSGLVVSGSRGHWRLGFTSMVDNRGPGILWIRGRRAPGSHVMRVTQFVLLASGAVRVDAPSGELHYTVAPPHYHWHFLAFDRFELHRTSDFKLLVRDHKSGFCIADHYGTAIGVPHGPPRFLGSCAQFHPEARELEEGESVGYTDRYPAFFHGQGIDISHVPAGTYWLVHRANPDFHLRESHYGDDAASLLIRIEWRSGAPTVTPLRPCNRERCQSR
jgi:dipeptidyl aminopeptidase/acylaminoacyl peptidase